MKRKIKFINTNEKDHETVQIDNRECKIKCVSIKTYILYFFMIK